MNPTGSWLALDIERNVKFEVGYIPFPVRDGPGHLQRRAGRRDLHLRQQHQGRGRREVPRLRHDPGARQVGGGERCRTSRPTRSTPPTSRPRRCSSRSWPTPRKIADGTGDFGYNIDVLTNDTFNNAMWKGMQGMLSGQTTPEEVAAAAAEELQEADRLMAVAGQPSRRAGDQASPAPPGHRPGHPGDDHDGGLLPAARWATPWTTRWSTSTASIRTRRSSGWRTSPRCSPTRRSGTRWATTSSGSSSAPRCRW